MHIEGQSDLDDLAAVKEINEGRGLITVVLPV